MASTIRVSDRVADKDGFRATVRYVGPVATSKTQDTIYAGLEWDVATRGKNDGSVTTTDGQEHRYFTCTAGAGSFVKTDLLNRGVSAAEALDARYNDKTEYEGGALVGISGKAVPMMLVGDEKVRAQQALSKLTGASLRESFVSRVDPGSLSGLCPKIREVDLSSNLMSDWMSIAELGRQLPMLRVLNLSGNKLQPLSPAFVAEKQLAGCLPALKTLIVSNTGLDWSSIACLDKLCPALEELHICGNGITSIVASPPTWIGVPAPDIQSSVANNRAVEASGVSCTPDSFISGLFTNLKTLNVSDNPLQEWGHVYAFSRLPSLTWLLASNCGIAHVWTEVSSSSGAFQILDQVSLTGNKLRSFASIDALDAFPALTTLRLTHTDLELPPITSGAASSAAAPQQLGPSEARQLIVARCPRIVMLNGSDVRPREREDGEKGYAKRVAVAFVEAVKPGSSVVEMFGPRIVPEASATNPYAALTLVPSAVNDSNTVTASGSGGAAAGKTTLIASAPVGFSKGSDSGVIRSSKPAMDRSSIFVTAPFPLQLVSASSTASASDAAAIYIPQLDPWSMGSSDTAAAAALQHLFPRYFMLAARCDLHAPASATASAATSIASSVVTLTLRSMAGNSCMMEPQTKKLPLSMTIGALKQLAVRLFRADPSLIRLSLKEPGGGSYPSLMEDDMKPLSYYAVAEGTFCSVARGD